jgi:NADPH:quinone reductase-like Zn-dependent oxidoreductase
MLSEVPATQTAIIQYHGGSFKITSGLAIPELKPQYVLVRTASVGLNPCDFKMPMRFPTPVSGTDMTSQVLSVL